MSADAGHRTVGLPIDLPIDTAIAAEAVQLARRLIILTREMDDLCRPHVGDPEMGEMYNVLEHVMQEWQCLLITLTTLDGRDR